MSKNMNADVESHRYMDLGVSSGKGAVRRAIVNAPQGQFPMAFCKIMEDIFSRDHRYCVISHADGAGTKSILAYLHYQINGDPSIFKGIAQDAIVMNLDDLLCVGVTGGFAVTSIVNRNAKRIDGRILKAIVDGSIEFIDRMNSLDIPMVHCGGETADLGDIVRTIIVDSVLTARFRKEQIIHNDIRTGSVIVALASGGEPATYEEHWNSGIGSNGLTFARHELLAMPLPENRMSEIVDDALAQELRYHGRLGVHDKLPSTNVNILDALLSPSRTFAPVVAQILASHRPRISGLVHCSGGGQLKCLRFGDGLVYHKDLGRVTEPLFKAIKDASGVSWGELAQVFNLGYRMEIFCDPEAVDDIMAIARQFHIGSKLIGHTEPATSKGVNTLLLTVEGESYTFSEASWSANV